MQLSGNSWAKSQLLELAKVAVEDVRVAAVGVRVRVLPDGLPRPAAGDLAGRAAPAGEDERVGVDEGVGVARAGLPPRGVGVEHGVDARAGLVAVAEGLDPRHHLAGRQAPALARVVGLQVQHARQGDAVGRPAAAVRQEVVGLRLTRRLARVREVVAAPDEAGVGRTCVVRRELGVNVRRAFGGLGNNELKVCACG